MRPSERAELKRIINGVFEMGVNKERMLNAVEHFIDTNYPEQKGIMRELIEDIDRHGGYRSWKMQLKMRNDFETIDK
jgi:hypothetical protein